MTDSPLAFLLQTTLMRLNLLLPQTSCTTYMYGIVELEARTVVHNPPKITIFAKYFPLFSCKDPTVFSGQRWHTNCYVFHNRAHYWPSLFVFNLLMFSLPPKPYGQFATAQTTLCRIGLSPPSFHIFLEVIFVTEWVSDFSDVTLVSEDTHEDKSYQVKKVINR